MQVNAESNMPKPIFPWEKRAVVDSDVNNAILSLTDSVSMLKEAIEHRDAVIQALTLDVDACVAIIAKIKTSKTKREIDEILKKYYIEHGVVPYLQ